jgi:hypothetical protein
MPFCFAVEMNLEYDANGNLVTGDGKYRTYNSLNQLSKVYNGSSTAGLLLYEFKYHPVEERVWSKKTYNSSGVLVETVYYFTKNNIRVVNLSGTYNYTYYYFNHQLVAQKNPDGSKLFVVGDNKGSTSVILNSSGSVLERTTYSPMGEILSGGRLNRYGYEGKEQEMGFGKIPTDGLVSYYALEGGGFDDGKGNPGSVVNASLTNGKVRDGYFFDGVGDFIAVNDSSNLDITGNLTLSAWIYPIENQVGYVVAKYQSYMIHLTGNPLVAQGGIWVGGNWNPLATTTSIPFNQWSHVVFTYNKSNAYIYLNGTLSGSGTNNNSIDVRNQIFCIGAKNSTVRDRDFNGSIDEVGVWNRALTSTEVTDLYNYGSQFDSGFRSTDFEFRRYNSNTGLFEQPDTVISNVYDPQSLNRYMFERGNAVNKRDDDGHSPYVVAGLVGFVAGSVGYMITHSGSGWSHVGKTYAAGVGGAIAAAAALSGSWAIIGGGGVANSVIGRALDKKSLLSWDAALDYAIGGAINTGTAGLSRATLPQPKDWLIKNPLSWLTTKTGQLFITNQLVENAYSSTGDYAYQQGMNSINGISNIAYLNNQVTINYQTGETWTSTQGNGGTGTYTPSGGGNPYPNAAPGWEPNPDAPRVCVSGC